ncbi:cAMP-responsive element modulator isoform X5 [Phasianus colchicus]|uniref:cAMP-responsive element modulator isoform X5 n=1 Tax=Phasianus colchicus TaxID=9054 RepID=UPI00129DE630|nr:cAMP-responsive element modulator isoform X5 [Phasianus colchicus]
MTQCAKKHEKTTERLMTMEMVESQQDDNAVDSMPDRDAVLNRSQPDKHEISSVSQVASIADDSAESEEITDTQKRREILSRRPSYRKILNELSSDTPAIPRIEEEKSEEEGAGISPLSMPGSLYHSSTGQFTATGDMPSYQLRTPTTNLPQGVVMAASPGALHSPQQLAEEATRKRELRLMKNREAARECRRKKKEYVKCLENRVAVLENQNKTLIEELKALKDLYCHKAE